MIDDGSHLLEETRACFETLFPRLRKGGLYMLEDWNWELNPMFRNPEHPFAKRDGLVGLVDDLVRVIGSSCSSVHDDRPGFSGDRAWIRCQRT